MSNNRQRGQYEEGIQSPRFTSLRQGDQTRRMMFNQGYTSIFNFQKKGDETYPLSQIGLDDRYQIEFDSCNQTSNPLKPHSLNQINKSVMNKINHQSLLSVERLIQLETIGAPSPKSLLSPKDILRSYSNIMSNSQQNSVSEFHYLAKANKLRKSRTTNIIHSSRSKESFNDEKPKNKWRKSKTQKNIDDSKTENIGRSQSREDELDIQLQMTSQQPKSEVINNQNVGEEKGMSKQWKKSGLLIIATVRKFVLKMQNLSLIRRYNNITYNQFYVINDISAHYDPFVLGKIYKQRGCFNNILNKMKQAAQKNCILQKIEAISSSINVYEPDQIHIIMWMIIMMNSILLLLIFNPMFAAFQHDLKQEGYTSSGIVKFCMSRVPLFIMLSDIAVRLNTAYYKRGIVVQLRWNIARHYIKHRLWLDLLLVFLFIIYDLENVNINVVVTLALIQKISQVKKELEDAVSLDKKKQAIYQLLKLCLFVIIIAHFCGCIFWSVGRYSQDYEESWIVKENLSHSTFYEKYVSSLYWATVTMLTVGYGDIVASNVIEKQIVILIMIFSCGIYAYSLNQIGVLIEEITYEDKEFKQIYSQLSLYMKKRNLDVKIQAEVKRYYQYLHWEKHNYSQKGEQMLNPLKHSLRQKVILNINYQLLEKNKMFLLQFSRQFLEQLALMMKEKEYMPDDKVWESQTDLKQNTNRLFFVIRGQVLQKVNDQFTVKIIEEGCYFNEKSFITDEAPNIVFMSTCISTLVYLDKQDFLEVIRNYPQDYEKYCKLRDQSKIQGFLSVLDSRCETCELFTHQFHNCPQVNSVINKEKLIYSINYSSPQLERTYVERKQVREHLNQSNISDRILDRSDIIQHKRFNSRYNRRYLLENIVDFLIDRNPLKYDEDNLIEQMKRIVEYNDNQEDILSPDQLKNIQNITSQLADNFNNEKHRSLIIHPVHFFGNKFQDEVVSPSKQLIQKKEEAYQREYSAQDSYQGSHQFQQQFSKSSTKGNQNSTLAGIIPQASNQHPTTTAQQLSRESAQYNKRYAVQTNPTKTTSQTEIPSNENLKDLPNDTDIRHLDRQKRESEYARRRMSTNSKSQHIHPNNNTHSQYQAQSPFSSYYQMIQSSDAKSAQSAPAQQNNTDISIDYSINYDNMLLQSNEQDDINVSEALKNLQSKKKQKKPMATYGNQNSNNNPNSTFTILEEETQENQTNFQRTLLVNMNQDQDKFTDSEGESGIVQTDLYPKREDTPQYPSAKLILDTTDKVNTSLNQNNQNSLIPNAYNNSLQTPGSVNTPANNQPVKRNSISIKLQNYIRSSSNNNTPKSPINKKVNNKGYLVASNSRGEEGIFFARMNSYFANNSRGGSQYGQNNNNGEDMVLSRQNSVRPRKKTESSFHKQHSFQKQFNRIKDEATPKNNSKQKQGSHNFIPSLTNMNGNLIEEEEVIFVSPQTHEFSDVPDFDKYKIYKDYFPYNNIDKIMTQIQVRYAELEQRRIKKKSKSQLSKLEKIMLKFNSKRATIKKKTASSPYRQKSKKKTLQQTGIPIIKSTFHQQHSIKNLQ